MSKNNPLIAVCQFFTYFKTLSLQIKPTSKAHQEKPILLIINV